ncbi:MAG: RHS repeat-associated core domain-containing protein [Pseudomonadota bacterium]|nr:RHS repeat-associated core domain-containing protein [Pseudomonadota bacterium]
MQARYYDPVIGRFYSNDPMDAQAHLAKLNIHGFNRYAYANNNPYRFTDPDGKESIDLSSLISSVNPLPQQVPKSLVGQEATSKSFEGVAKGVADSLGGKEMFESVVEVGAIPTPPFQASAVVSAVVLATVYDDPKAAASAVAGKAAGLGAAAKGVGETGQTLIEETASALTEIVIDAGSEELEQQ